MTEVERLIERAVIVFGSCAVSELERETFFAFCDAMSYSELLSLLTAESMGLLREHVAQPASLIVTMN